MQREDTEQGVPLQRQEVEQAIGSIPNMAACKSAIGIERTIETKYLLSATDKSQCKSPSSTC
jgi:hypothetical protein